MLIILSIAIIICSYIYILLKPKTDFQILQSSLCNISDNILYEKYPIFINDNIIDANDLLSTLFKYQYMFTKSFTLTQTHTMINYSKYLIIHNIDNKECVVKVSNPSRYTNNISIIVNPFNVLVIPYKWKIETDECNLRCIQLNDFSHYLFNIHVN